MSQAAATAAVLPRKNFLQYLIGDIFSFIKVMSLNRIGFVGFILAIAMMLFALVGPIFVPLDVTTKPAQIFKPAMWVSPSGERYWLGTDFQGRDIWTQIIHGGRDPLLVAITASLISTSIAATLGALSAYAGGRLDDFIMSLTDVFLSVPQFVLLIVLAGIVRFNEIYLLAVLIGLIGWPTLTRSIRAQVLSLKERDYIEAARSLGLSRWHIIFKELLPNMMGFITISFIFGIISAMSQQLGLVLLGLVPFTGIGWPVMIYQAQIKGAIFLEATRGYIYGPIVAFVIFQTAMFTMLRSLEDLFNPRLRSNA